MVQCNESPINNIQMQNPRKKAETTLIKASQTGWKQNGNIMKKWQTLLCVVVMIKFT
jgi:hypothetical protein